MSSEVKRYDAVHIRYEDNNIRYGEGCEVEMVTARDYDALQSRLDAAERNVKHWQDLAVANRKVADEALAELSALKAQQVGQEPVGVIREAETMGVAPYADIWPWLVPGTKLYTLPSAAPAQEVPDHFRGVTQMAEQGERQEAVVYAVHAKGAQVDHHCPLVSPDMAADYLPGCATPLYTTPQPAPAQDVAPLLEALRVSRQYVVSEAKYEESAHNDLDLIDAALAAHDKQSGGEE